MAVHHWNEMWVLLHLILGSRPLTKVVSEISQVTQLEIETENLPPEGTMAKAKAFLSSIADTSVVSRLNP